MDHFLDELKKRDAALDAEEVRLAAELALVRAERERLKIAADVYHSFTKEAPIQAGARRPSQAEAIEALLRKRGGFGRMPDIYTALLNEGLLNAKNKRSAYNQVYAVLHQRDDRFREVGGGVWALVGTPPPSNGLEAHGILRVSGSAELGRPLPVAQAEPTSAELSDLLEQEPTREADDPDGDPGWRRVPDPRIAD